MQPVYVLFLGKGGGKKKVKKKEDKNNKVRMNNTST